MNELERRAFEVTEKLRNLKKGSALPKYISHIRFPLFKNLVKNSRIEFSFPVTALVGANGSGKTSALHALYGAPLGKSSSDFWFATDLDPIEEGNGEPNRFIYGHWLENAQAPIETRKARVAKSKTRKPGYFEPTKATKGDSMDLSPFLIASGKEKGKSKDRWNPVDRPLVYLNFRSEISAFDKYLFWSDPRPSKNFPSKHHRLQNGARHLNVALVDGRSHAMHYRRQMILENRELSATELLAICEILGKKYSSATAIRHRYYGGTEGLSVRFVTQHATYSEAFAGAGELAVASLVMHMHQAGPHSLVLLDEPEVSLHPGAQERLLVYLLEESLKQKHQIVFTTHSPSLLRLLPPDAIKVFHEAADGRFGILETSHPYAAFERLGAPVPTKIRILVEDKLAREVVEIALLNLTEPERSIFEVRYMPGGASAYFSLRIPTLMMDIGHTYIMLDGDQYRGEPFPNPDSIPATNNSELTNVITSVTGCSKVQLGLDGGKDTNLDTKKYEQQRRYLRYLYDRVRFLPQLSPEHIVLRAVKPDLVLGDRAAAKWCLKSLVKTNHGKDDADTIFEFCKVQLASKRVENEDLADITAKLRSMLLSLQVISPAPC